jgi:hypothetical protein
MVRTLVDMEASYLSASFFREIVAAESYAYDPSRPKPAFVTLNGELLFEKRCVCCEQRGYLCFLSLDLHLLFGK